eukprot:COSAG01_NODE_3447_length_6079_cov_12.927343_1_plen_94_part_10
MPPSAGCSWGPARRTVLGIAVLSWLVSRYERPEGRRPPSRAPCAELQSDARQLGGWLQLAAALVVESYTPLENQPMHGQFSGRTQPTWLVLRNQ